MNRLYILVCEIGYYGENCDNRCSRYCLLPRQCDRVTGQCYGGCQPGWYTITCEQSRCFDFFFYCHLWLFTLIFKRLIFIAIQYNLRFANLNIWVFFCTYEKGLFQWIIFSMVLFWRCILEAHIHQYF